MIDITVMIKDSDYRTVKITPEMLGELAKSIQTKGSEWIQLRSGEFQVVGFLVTGEETGDRVIVLGDSLRESETE